MLPCSETRKNDEPMLKSRLAWGFTDANTDFNLGWWESLVVVLKQDIDWESPFLWSNYYYYPGSYLYIGFILIINFGHSNGCKEFIQTSG